MLSARRDALGGLHPQTLDACYQVALSLLMRGALGEAEALAAESYAGRVEVLGEGHYRTQQSAQELQRIQQLRRDETEQAPAAA